MKPQDTGSHLSSSKFERPPARGCSVVVNDLNYGVPSRDILPACANSAWKWCGRKKSDSGNEYKLLLDSVNLLARPGELMAIIGPSGSGKTTLLNVIAMRSPSNRLLSGEVLFNGEVLSKSAAKHTLNYVMAHDKLLPYLTVYESLFTAAALKLPQLSISARKEIVERVLKDTCMTHYRNSYIGGEWRKGLSTGEIKRVTIGIELLDEPSVLILDEPTSNLDSQLSLSIMEILRKEALRGRTVICTVHQPSSQIFEMLDNITLINMGKIVYSGTPYGSITYFDGLGHQLPKDWNPCDFLLDVISGGPKPLEDIPNDISQHERTASLADAWTDSEEGKRVALELLTAAKKPIDLDPPQVHKPNWFCEVGTLWKRCTLNSLRNPMTAVVILLIQAMQGLILGGIFYDKISAWPGPKPPAVIEDNFWLNEFTQAYIKGIEPNGNRPIVRMFENGVDNNGSFILTSPTQGVNAWQLPLMTIVANMPPCVQKTYKMLDRGYPDMHYKDMSPISDWNDFTPERIYLNAMGLYQLFDVAYTDGPNKRPFDLSFVRDCEDVICLLSSAAPGINAFLSCVGLPPLTMDSNDLPFEPVAPPVLPPTQFYEFSTGSATLDGLVKNLLGPHLMKLLDAANTWHTRITSCKDPICGQVKKISDTLLSAVNEIFNTVFTSLNLSGCLFFVATILGFASYDALLTFPQERSLFNRETANGFYRPSTFFVAKNLADLPFQLVPSLVMATIFYFLVGLSPTAGQFFTYFAITTLTSFAAYGFGYMISAASPRMEVALLVAPLTLVVWLVLAGFFLRDPDIPAWIDWFKYFSFYRWSFFSLVANQFPPGEFFGVLPNDVILGLTGVTQPNVGAGVLYLILLGGSYRVLGYFFLTYTNRQVGLEA